MADRMTKSPRDKYTLPQTSSQEYGWDTTLLVSDFIFECIHDHILVKL